jgi:hypothetical protein
LIKISERDYDSNQSFVFATGAKEDSSTERDVSIMRINVLTIQFTLERLEN